MEANVAIYRHQEYFTLEGARALIDPWNVLCSDDLSHSDGGLGLGDIQAFERPFGDGCKGVGSEEWILLVNVV